MVKKTVKSVLKRLEIVNPWYLLILALIFGAISTYALRQNNITMIKLRNDVFTADKQNGDIEGTLRKLREFVYAHMNTDLSTSTGVKPPIQLKYRYERLLQQQNDGINTANSQLYTDAQSYCEKNFPQSFYGAGRLPCIRDYLSKHGVATQVSTAPPTIPDSLYKFDFVSPTWTPDLAGWTLLIAAILTILFIVRIGIEFWLKHELKDNL